MEKKGCEKKMNRRQKGYEIRKKNAEPNLHLAKKIGGERRESLDKGRKKKLEEYAKRLDSKGGAKKSQARGSCTPLWKNLHRAGQTTLFWGKTIGQGKGPKSNWGDRRENAGGRL